MKKIVLMGLFLLFLASSKTANAVPGAFFCVVESGNCVTEIKNPCEPGKTATFPDGTTCNDLNLNECGKTTGYFCNTPISCTPGTTSCSSNKLVTCNDTGNSYSYTDCSSCIPDHENPGEYRCYSGTTDTDADGNGGGGDGQAPVIDLTELIKSIGKENGDENSTFKFLTDNKLGFIVSAAIPIVLALAGIGLLLFMIRAGFMFLTSAGDPKKLEAAKGALTASVIGFIIIFTAFWIVEIVNYVFKLQAGVGN